MSFNFSTAAKDARSRIPVPELSMALIRQRSRSATISDRVRGWIVLGAIGLAMLGTGVAFGSKAYEGVRVWLSGGKTALVIDSFAMVREPTPADLRAVVAKATFPIVFPASLPAGTTMRMLQFAPTDRPNFVIVEYQNKQTNFHAGFSLVDTASINANSSTSRAEAFRPQFRANYSWRVGRETVLVPDLSPQDADRIKAAMMKASPADSLALTEALLRKVTVLGTSSELADIAERYAPSTGRSVLLDRALIRRIPNLAKQGSPILDDRTIYLSNVPLVHGQPDYSKATLRWPRVIVIPAAGVRALESVLRFAGVDCACRLLFAQPESAMYWIWRIPMSGSPVEKYSIDARTLVVTPLGDRR